LQPRSGNEKGGVDCEGGYFRRNHWVRLPGVNDLAELNTYLELCCHKDQQRILSSRTYAVGTAMLLELPHHGRGHSALASPNDKNCMLVRRETGKEQQMKVTE
jgi:hypothetical protein